MCPSRPVKPCIIVHGGAWNIPQTLTSRTLKGVQLAVSAGYSLLDGGHSAVEAVEAAVKVLEDDGAFDAGYGSCLNADCEIEMDAVIMADDDKDGVRLGAVAAVGNVRNPVSLARNVMEKTDHCLIVSKGAEKFAEEIGMETVNGEELITKEMREEWKRFGKYDAAVSGLFNGSGNSGHDTVGAVALDREGKMAVATSTGGITSARAGRVGDSPIVGCGAFCDKDVGGVSVTGHGEGILKTTLARSVVWTMENGSSPEVAAKKALNRMRIKTGSCGGVIAMDKDGNMARSFTTERMAWAKIDSQGRSSFGIDK